MTHRVELHAAALAQLSGLPADAFDALVKRTADLVAAPWDSWSLDDDEPAFRQVTFHQFGLMSFHLDEQNLLLRIYDITWAG